MSSIAFPFEDKTGVTGWIGGLIQYAIGLTAMVMGAAWALDQTWNSLAAVFSFTNPLGGYWSCALVVLAAYAVFLVYRIADNHVIMFDNSKDFTTALFGNLGLIAPFLVIAVLAWAITNYLA